MKLTTGVKWGLVAGLVVGVSAVVLAYMSIMSILDALVEYAYREMVKMGPRRRRLGERLSSPDRSRRLPRLRAESLATSLSTS
jgi:hypothetical protein